MLSRDKAELYEKDLSFLFEVIAPNLIECPFAFDGVTGLTSEIGKSRQLFFEGKMWILKDVNSSFDWQQTFKAIVTDKRITKQGISIKIWVGEYFGEGSLEEVFS